MLRRNGQRPTMATMGQQEPARWLSAGWARECVSAPLLPIDGYLGSWGLGSLGLGVRAAHCSAAASAAAKSTRMPSKKCRLGAEEIQPSLIRRPIWSQCDADGFMDPIAGTSCQLGC